VIGCVGRSAIECIIIWVVVAAVVSDISEVDQVVATVDAVELQVHANLGSGSEGRQISDPAETLPIELDTDHHIINLAPRFDKEQRLILLLFIDPLLLLLLPRLPWWRVSNRSPILIPWPVKALLPLPLHTEYLKGVVDLVHDLDGG